jgi:hypothetical protein
MAFASVSKSTPSHEEDLQMRRRISGEFSPMPAVNTSASMPPAAPRNLPDFVVGSLEDTKLQT